MSHKSIQSYLLIGKSGSGKTYHSKSILENQLTHIKMSNRWLISPTAKADLDTTLLPYFDEDNIENEYSNDFLLGILLELIKQERKDVYENHYYDIDLNTMKRIKLKKSTPPPYEEYLIFIDDCVEFLKCGNSIKGVAKLITRSRHYGINLIITSQYYTAVSGVVRSNVKNLIIFGCNAKERKKLNDEHSLFQKSKTFDEYFQYLTKEPYSYVIINYNYSASKVFDDNKITPKEFLKKIKDGSITTQDIL